MIQPRDLTILETVFDYRFLTLSLLHQLLPPDAAKTPRKAIAAAQAKREALTPDAEPTPRPGTNLARRLKGLFTGGYLDRIRVPRGTEHVYALGQAGATLLRSHQPRLPIADTDWREKNRTVSQLFVEHTLMVARLRVALTLAAKASPATQLEVFLPEARAPKARWRHEREDAYVNPDAFFIVREIDRPDDRQRLAYFVEADRSTMALKRLRQKFAYYVACYTARVHQAQWQLPSFRVLTICKSQERAASLLNLAIAPDSPIPPPLRSLFLFTTEETYATHPENVLATVWRAADQPQVLASLIGSPLPRRT